MYPLCCINFQYTTSHRLTGCFAVGITTFRADSHPLAGCEHNSYDIEDAIRKTKGMTPELERVAGDESTVCKERSPRWSHSRNAVKMHVQDQ